MSTFIDINLYEIFDMFDAVKLDMFLSERDMFAKANAMDSSMPSGGAIIFVNCADTINS